MIGLLADHWNQWTAIALFSAFLFCFAWVRPNFGLPASLLLAAVSYSAIYTWIYVPNRYITVDVYNQMALRYFAADSLCKAMLILTPLMVLSKSRQTFLLLGEVAVGTFAFLTSAVALWEARLGCNGLNCGGLIGNASISMSCLACMLPIFIRSWKRQWPVLAMAALAIFLSKSSIAVGLFSAYACIWVTHSLIKNVESWDFRDIPKIVMGCAVGGGFLASARLALGKELLNDSDRFMIWKYMMYSWSQPWNVSLGTGFGTYHVLSIILQHWGGPSGPRHIAAPMHWETLHNDPLQMLFECGVIGLVLLCITYYSALAKVVREKQWPVAMSIVLYGMYMCLNPALHNPIPVLFGAWLFVYALRQPTKEFL